MYFESKLRPLPTQSFAFKFQVAKCMPWEKLKVSHDTDARLAITALHILRIVKIKNDLLCSLPVKSNDRVQTCVYVYDFLPPSIFKTNVLIQNCYYHL